GAVIHGVRLDERAAYPPNVRPLTLPGSILAVDEPRRGAVVLDATPWDDAGPNAVRGRRFASALLANLGAAFEPHEATRPVESIPLRHFELIGESPYFSQSPARLEFRSN